MNAVHQGESSPLLPPKAPAQGGWVRKAVIGTCVVAGCVAALAASSGALSAGAAPVASRTHPLGARSGKTVKARVNKSAPNLFESGLGHDGHEYPGTEGCESICEGEDIDEATCDTMFFCQWDHDYHGNGRCWSKVGTKPCPDTREQLEDIMIWRGEDHDDYVHKDADYRNHHPHNGEDGYEPAEDGHRSGYDTEETEGWGIHVPGIHVDMPCNPATDDDCHPLEDAVNAVEEGAGGRYIDWLGRARASLDYGVAAFIERDANSILDFVDLSRVGPLALAVNPIDLLLPQFNQARSYSHWSPYDRVRVVNAVS